jgi:hypothetical protein
VVVAGASKQSAEALALSLREAGVVVDVEPVRRTTLLDRIGRFVARHSAKLALVTTAAVMGLLLIKGERSRQPRDLLELIGFVAIPAVAIFASLRLMLSGGAGPLLTDLPEGDPALLRLADGVRRRAARIEERAKALTAPQQLVAADLLAATRDLAAAAQALLKRARAQSGDDPERADSREAAVARLTEMGASLDDVLAQLDASSGEDARAAEAMRRLRDELLFVQRAMPEVDAAHKGLPAPPPSEDGLDTSPRGVKVKSG